ncbi:MAG: PH domain-containing protein [Halovenus sp.]
MTDGGDDPDVEATDSVESGSSWGGLRDESGGDGSGWLADEDTEQQAAEPGSTREESEQQDVSGLGTTNPEPGEHSGAFGGETGNEHGAGKQSIHHDGEGSAGEAPELTTEEIQTYTTDRRSRAPRGQLQWGIRTTIGTVVLGLLFTAGILNLDVTPLIGPVVVGALLALGLVWVVLRYRVWVYQIRADAIYLERGIVTHVRTLVPYVRIQHVDTSQGPLERALGLSTLVVYTAGSRGADVSIPGLRPEQARDLQQRVKELAIEAEGGDAL